MSEHPILFNGEMVRAILDGRKTQTRRPIKFNMAGRVQLHGKQWHPDDRNAVLGCPCGQPGDILWVRESCQGCYDDFCQCGPRFMADGKFVPIRDNPQAAEQWEWLSKYRGGGYGPFKVVPSIHMPRWAGRIDLRVKSVRVQRVQDIAENDAWAEGCEKGDRADSGRYLPKNIPILNKHGGLRMGERDGYSSLE